MKAVLEKVFKEEMTEFLLKSLRLVMHDYHEGIKVMVTEKLPRAGWQWGVHFERDMPAYVLAPSRAMS